MDRTAPVENKTLDTVKILEAIQQLQHHQPVNAISPDQVPEDIIITNGRLFSKLYQTADDATVLAHHVRPNIADTLEANKFLVFTFA